MEITPEPVKLGAESTINKQMITINGYLFARSPRNGKFKLVNTSSPERQRMVQKMAMLNQDSEAIIIEKGQHGNRSNRQTYPKVMPSLGFQGGDSLY